MFAMAFKPTYHERNLENLQKLGDKTKAVAVKWYEYLIDNGIDVLIYETIRTKEQQAENVRKGASKTMKSYHLVGQALDFVPVKDGKADWNGYDDPAIKKAIAKAKEFGFTWGGDWDNDGQTTDERFVDKPHLQYDKIPYGSDTFKTKDVKITLPEPKVVSAKSTAPAKPKAPAKPQPRYKIGEVTGDVWLHSKPDFKESTRVRVLKKGEKYRVYGEVNGMYNLGNSYVSKKYIKILK
jgi:peptidoglycan LD-endopeptidase CwlK